MNATDIRQQESNVSDAVTTVFTSLAVVTVLVDISYIIVCFKALKKTFHNLTILALFCSDIILGVSSALFSLGPVLKHETIGSCILQIFLFSFGIQSNYCLILLLCLQRYLVVRSFNFGTIGNFDKNKFIYIGGSMCFVFILSLCALILIPRAENIQVCRPQDVYGDRFYIVVLVICLPVTVIIFLLLIMSIITSYRLWKIYFKGTIAPMQGIREEINITDHVQSSHIKLGQSCQTLQNKVSLVPRQRNSEEEITSIQDIDIQQVNLTAKNKGDNIEKGKSNKIICSQNRRAFDGPHCTNCKRAEKKIENVRSESSHIGVGNFITFQMTKEIQRNSTKSISTKNDCFHEENRETDMVGLNHNVSTASTDFVNSFDVTTQLKKSWEMRAFLTTIIIAIQTVILTGPFVASYWIEILSNLPLTLQTKIILLIPFLINSLSNPFLYAWRIPEIRQEFGRLFRINT